MPILLFKKKLPSRLFFSIMKAIRVKKQLEEKIKIVITNNLMVSLLSSVNSSSCELCLKFSKIMNPNIIFAAKYIVFFPIPCYFRWYFRYISRLKNSPVQHVTITDVSILVRIHLFKVKLNGLTHGQGHYGLI